MKVGWLADAHDPPGGAELSQAGFRLAAPEGVEVVDCPPSDVAGGLDAYVLHNHLSYERHDFLQMEGAKTFRYFHDVRPQKFQADQAICCSPLQADALRFDGVPHIPPPIDLAAFRPTRQQRRHPDRSGAVCIGAFMNPGKGGHLISEWAEANEPVDVYGFGPFLPAGANVKLCGPADHHQISTVLSGYERFVFLPTALEPFGRCVVEAWAAGLEIVTNKLVGARYWIEEHPEKLETAAGDFWEVVLDG